MTAVVLAMLSILVVAVLALGYAAGTHLRRRHGAGPGQPLDAAAGPSYDAGFLGGFAGEPDAAPEVRERQDQHLSR